MVDLARQGGKAVARLKALDDMLLTKEGYEFSTLWWNLRTVSGYIRNNTHTLVNYGARFRKGLPISSSIAESAVNLDVSHRMAKKQQMRWTTKGPTAWRRCESPPLMESSRRPD